MLYAPPLMHIPDGFLSFVVSLGLWVLALLGVGYALRQVGRELGERQAPLMGVLAAAIFAGQMLNFPVAGGTSGHLIGAALATILMGPWAAIVIMTCVVGIQALIFQDGGLLALGGNLFNMAIVATAVSYFVYSTVQRLAGGRRWGVLAGGFAAAWLSVVVTALAAALELALSGTSPANVAVPAMGGVHILIGLGEGLITVGALAFLYVSRPDLLKAEEPRPLGIGVWLAGLALAMLLAVASPLASRFPDGLEAFAEQQGFAGAAQLAPIQLIPDYVFPGVSNEALATIVAGLVGTLIVFGAALAVGYLRKNHRTAPNQM